MLINKIICTKPYKQILLNPSKIETTSILKESIRYSDRYLHGSDIGNTVGANLFNLEPQNVLAKVIDYLLTKRDLTADDELIFKKALLNAFNKFSQDKNKLGEGYHNSIFKLNEKYAVKCPLNAEKSDIYESDAVVSINPQFNELSTYYGGELLSFGKFKILKNLGKHTPAGVLSNLYGKSALNYYFSEYLPMFAKVPQESYDAIANDCAKLNRFCDKSYYYTFDYMNTNNIVLKGDKLHWVDVLNKQKVPSNSVTQLLDMLLLKEAITKRIYNGYGNSTNDAQIIFRKIILASARARLTVRSLENYTNGVWKLILNNLKADSQPQNVISKLEEIYKIQDTKTRLDETNKLLDNLFSKNNQ